MYMFGISIYLFYLFHRTNYQITTIIVSSQLSILHSILCLIRVIESCIPMNNHLSHLISISILIMYIFCMLLTCHYTHIVLMLPYFKSII